MIECPFCKNKPELVNESHIDGNGKRTEQHRYKCSESGGFMTAAHDTKAEAENAWDKIVTDVILTRMENCR